MNQRITNKLLNQLLLDLGFERGSVTERNVRIWSHPKSGCELLLPNNKTLDRPRAADLEGVRTQLDHQGHLDAAQFDTFLLEGRIPQL